MTGYMAPLEGITTHVYRNAYASHFAPLDKYFTPFIVPASKRPLRTREMRDVLPANNAGLPVVPQILTNDAEQFLECCRALADLGYREVNLNTGCPSGTVPSRGKGAGFLKTPDLLDEFLEKVFDRTPVAVSVKTRLGWADPSEMEELLPVFNRYPLTELILHPRVRQEYYKGTPHTDSFLFVLAGSAHPVIYNGNLFTPEDIRRLEAEAPGTAGVMLGRGLLAMPFLWNLASGTDLPGKDTLRDFHDEIFASYLSILSGPDPVIHKMKELWCYMIQSFTNYPDYEKAMHKVHRLPDYERLVAQIFASEELSNAGFLPPSGWQEKQSR